MSQGRHASKSSRTKAALVVGIVAVVAAIAVAVIAFASRGESPSGGDAGSGAKPVPQFAFTVAKTQAVPTKSGVSPQKLANKAKAAAKPAATLLDTFYTDAFLDPNVWGKDPTAFDDFTADAKIAAAKKLMVLTAGPNAAAELKDLQPAPSKVSFRVLFDDKGAASQVMATVLFNADATLNGGGRATLVSSGQFFLKRVGGSWKVVAFEVKRADTAGPPPASQSSGPTPTGGQS
ncbi:MAG: hypothetical protein ABI828_02615 [Actinomycetota bacterium]